MSQIETLSDRRALINNLGGEPFLYTNPASKESTIEALWESPSNAQAMGFIVVESAKPAIQCITDDVSDATNACTLRRYPAADAEKLYYIVSVSPDGTGITRLELSEDAVQN